MRRALRLQLAAAACLPLLFLGCTSESDRKRLERLSGEDEVYAAVDGGSLKSLKELLKEDPTLADSRERVAAGRGRNIRKDTALTLAVKKGRHDLFDALVAAGADVNLGDTEGRTPLLAALGLKTPPESLAFVRILLEKGADPSRGDLRGSTPLHEVVNQRKGDDKRALLTLLLEKARTGGGPDGRGWTPLHYAARRADPDDIRFLVGKGADPNVRSTAPNPSLAMSDDVAGSTPLAVVALDRQIAAAAALCALGADPDVKDSAGASAQQVAARVAAAEGAKSNDPSNSDVARHRNMAAFLARGGSCEALLTRRRAGETIPDAEVDRIANESECAAGWGWACGQAGWAYHRGEGAKEDDGKAFALFRKGCDDVLTKSTWCCGMTGVFHVEGTAGPKNPAEGARWLSKGCETPDPKRADEQSCNRLGLLLAEGTGVPRDLAKARAMFKRACDEKYDRACANLLKYAGN